MGALVAPPASSPASPTSAPVRLRAGPTHSLGQRRHWRLGSLLALLAGTAALATALSLWAVEDALWQSNAQLLAVRGVANDSAVNDSAASGSAAAADPARAQWIAAMRAMHSQDVAAAAAAAATAAASSAPASTRALTLPPDVHEPPRLPSDAGAETSAERQCFSTRDYGVIPRLANSSRAFCAEPVASAAGDAMVTSSYTHYELQNADLRATTFRHLRLDLRAARVAHDISAASQDGGGHDPRLTYSPGLAACSCAAPQDEAHGAPRVWRFFLAADPDHDYVACSARPMTQHEWLHGLAEAGSEAEGEAAAAPLVLAGRHAVILSRKDDHNPFFQLSALFNAWVALRALDWPADATQLVFLDKGLPTPMDELQRALLAPTMPAIRGQDVLGRVLHLESALVAPIETSGPLMTHLNDAQPCQRNRLLAEFRRVALAAMNVSESGGEAGGSTDGEAAGQCLVTVISRRTYGGRRVQRMWTNEAEVLERMRADYGDRCEFQSLDFAELSMAQQMRVMVDSDVVIGMHGAGMVNVMWTRPQTLVVEIFPKRRFRWGYRNLCQFLGCDWHDFRGGRDVPVGRDRDPNAMDKRLDYGEWSAFFDPLLRARLAGGAAGSAAEA